MMIERPDPARIPQLRQLWKCCFDEEEAFLDAFFARAFAPERCRCVLEQGRVAAALYWFDCLCRGEKIAYLYAVATAPEFRNRGYCRALMEQTHCCLAEQGYRGAMLVPATDTLAKMYGTMGYAFCTRISDLECTAAEPAVPLRRVSREEYATLRRELLPPGGVEHGEAMLALLEEQCAFFAGEDLLITGRIRGDTLEAEELLGDPAAAPGALQTLGVTGGSFCLPGNGRNYAMYRSFETGGQAPCYFGLAME